MMVKCNYSERSNSLQRQIRNGHLYLLLSREGKHFEPHPSRAETNKYGLKDVPTIPGWSHRQLLAHKMFLSEPTHIDPFMFSCRKQYKQILPHLLVMLSSEASKENKQSAELNIVQHHSYKFIAA